MCASLLAAAQAARAQDAAAGADSLSLEECVRAARERAPGPQAAAADAAAAARESQSVARNGRPVFRAFGGATVAPKGFYDPIVTNLGEYSLKAGMDLPLLDGGGRGRARQRASNEAALAGLEQARARREAGDQAAELGADVLRLAEKEEVESASLEWLDRLAEILKPGVAAGQHSPGDLLRVALERDGVDASLSATRTGLAASRRELGQLLGLPPGVAPALRPPAPGEEPAPGAADSARVMAALEALPEVRIADLTQAQQRLDLEDVEGQNALGVDLSADAGLSGSDLTALVPEDLRLERPGATFLDRLLHRDLGASLTLELHRVVSDPTRGPAREARQLALRAAALRAAAERDTQRRLLLDLLGRWQSAALRRAALQALAARAEENLLRSKSLYVAGSFSLLELLDARRVAEDARERLADARAEERAARLEVSIRP